MQILDLDQDITDVNNELVNEMKELKGEKQAEKRVEVKAKLVAERDRMQEKQDTLIEKYERPPGTTRPSNPRFWRRVRRTSIAEKRRRSSINGEPQAQEARTERTRRRSTGAQLSASNNDSSEKLTPQSSIDKKNIATSQSVQASLQAHDSSDSSAKNRKSLETGITDSPGISAKQGRSSLSFPEISRSNVRRASFNGNPKARLTLIERFRRRSVDAQSWTSPTYKELRKRMSPQNSLDKQKLAQGLPYQMSAGSGDSSDSSTKHGVHSGTRIVTPFHPSTPRGVTYVGADDPPRHRRRSSNTVVPEQQLVAARPHRLSNSSTVAPDTIADSPT